MSSSGDDDRALFDSWLQMEQRMAWYAGIYKKGSFLVTRETALEWRQGLSKAMEKEYLRMSQGNLPRRLTPFVVLGRGPGGDDDGGASFRGAAAS
jgi:hypothetical protein